MKISLNWLKDFVDLKNEKPAQIAEALTMSIAEVEAIQQFGGKLDKVVVGHVLECQKHPNADRLKLCTVDVGSQKLSIICGGANMRQGLIVPVALIGAKLPNGMIIRQAKIRGIESQGMICSEKELGLSDELENIITLNPKNKLGTPFTLPSDVIFEIDNKSLSHRSDLFSHLGIARELAVALGKKFKEPKIKVITPADKIKFNIKVEGEAKKLCPRVMIQVLDNVKIQPSPSFIQERLKAVGVRPINNIVDVTNYGMLEYGQPLHAFDYHKVDQKMVVRLAKKGEEVITLDGKARHLSEKMLVINDASKIIDLVGIMGGANTEISSATKTVILQASTFNSYNIRSTSRTLGLRTEAVLRFEKNLSLALPELALKRAVELLNMKPASKIIDLYPKKYKPAAIVINPKQLETFVGQKIPQTKINSILKALGCKVVGNKITPPAVRTDLNIPADIYEEVARLYGYKNIQPQPLHGTLEPKIGDETIIWERKIKNILASLGLSEVTNYSFYGQKTLHKSLLTNKEHLSLANSISPELKYLRTSLLPNLLESAEKNLHHFSEFKIFEIGHVYFPQSESRSVAGLIIASDARRAFREIKGIVKFLLESLNIPYQVSLIKKTPGCDYWNMYADNTVLKITAQEKILGTLALAHSQIIHNFDLKRKQAAFFSLSLKEIVSLATTNRQYQTLAKFPPVVFDLAFIVSDRIATPDFSSALKELGQPLLKKVDLFDVYTGKPLQKGERSLAYHLTFQDPNKTLTDNEINTFRHKIISGLKNQYQARLRG